MDELGSILIWLLMNGSGITRKKTKKVARKKHRLERIPRRRTRRRPCAQKRARARAARNPPPRGSEPGRVRLVKRRPIPTRASSPSPGPLGVCSANPAAAVRCTPSGISVDSTRLAEPGSHHLPRPSRGGGGPGRSTMRSWVRIVPRDHRSFLSSRVRGKAEKGAQSPLAAAFFTRCTVCVG
jgi:hypothetical protein